MSDNFKVIRKLPGIYIYEIPTLSEVTAEMLRDFNWPPGITSAGFMAKQFCPQVVTEEQIPERYNARIVYSADKGGIVVPACGAPGATAVCCEVGKNLQEFKTIFLETHKVYFQTWGDKVGAGLMSDVVDVAENSLPGAKHLYLECSGLAAGVAAIIKWKDVRGEPVDWIPWVWIASELPKEVRESVRTRIADWMQKNVDGKVQCAIDAFNVRSQKFFIKLGFFPQCIYIGKP